MIDTFLSIFIYLIKSTPMNFVILPKNRKLSEFSCDTSIESP